MKRPNGITFLSLVLGWLTMGGFGNAWVILTGKFNLPPILGYLALAYGIATLFSCIGLWRMKKWSLFALRSWMVVCTILLVVFYIGAIDRILEKYIGAIAFSIFLGFIFWSLDNYVSSKFKTVT